VNNPRNARTRSHITGAHDLLAWGRRETVAGLEPCGAQRLGADSRLGELRPCCCPAFTGHERRHWDLLRPSGNLRDELFLRERRRQIPRPKSSRIDTPTGLRLVAEHESSWQGRVPRVDPDLPVDVTALKRKMMTRGLADMTPQEQAQARTVAEKEMFLARREQILDHLSNGTPEQRRLAAGTAATWVRYIPEALPIFRKIIANEKESPGLRYKAVTVLGKYEGQKAVPLIRTCLGPANPESLRRVAAFRIARLGHKEGIPILIELLRTNDTKLQVYTVTSLRSVTGRSFGYPMGIEFTKKIMPEQDGAREKAIAAWEAWWRKEGAAFSFPYPPR
jgi:hypothetical protein